MAVVNSRHRMGDTPDKPQQINARMVRPNEIWSVIALPGGPASGSLGPYNVYYLKNRDWRKLSSNGAAGPSGMMTEVRVYQSLPPQNIVSQTYV